MTITINGTTVNIEGDRIIGFALNNLVNRFEATTDKEEGWEYTLKGDPGIGLPAVTEADNSKVAYVENGVWVAKLLSEIQGGI